jgi:hypothetical protein
MCPADCRYFRLARCNLGRQPIGCDCNGQCADAARQSSMAEQPRAIAFHMVESESS